VEVRGHGGDVPGRQIQVLCSALPVAYINDWPLWHAPRRIAGQHTDLILRRLPPPLGGQDQACGGGQQVRTALYADGVADSAHRGSLGTTSDTRIVKESKGIAWQLRRAVADQQALAKPGEGLDIILENASYQAIDSLRMATGQVAVLCTQYIR